MIICSRRRTEWGSALNHQDTKFTKEHQEVGAEVDALASTVVDAGLKVHRALGPDLMESIYEHCLARELQLRGLPIVRQVQTPIVYEGLVLEAAYRMDMVVANRIVIEVKAADAFSPLHEAQLLTYLKLSGHRLGFLMNFNVPLFKNGVRRVVL